ncbi:MAG: alpha/beta hydrolase [Acidimicrobiia bacterium]
MSSPTIATSDGESLEAILTTAENVSGSIVLCHPHPQHGGTMQAPMLEAIAAEAADRGLDTLRFNFRGIGSSTGSYGSGVEEVNDVAAAVSWMMEHHAPVIGIAGWSFGAAVALNWVASAASDLAYVGIAPPVDSPLTPSLPLPHLLPPAHRTFIVGDRDQFLDANELEAYGTSIGAHTIRYTTADHFFVLRHERLATDAVDALIAPAS